MLFLKTMINIRKIMFQALNITETSESLNLILIAKTKNYKKGRII